EVRGHEPGEPLEPPGAELSEHRGRVWNRLPHDHVERADAVAGHKEKVAGIHFVDFADLAPSEERQRKPARDDRAHTRTSADSAAAARGRASSSSGSITSRRNSPTCSRARPV